MSDEQKKDNEKKEECGCNEKKGFFSKMIDKLDKKMEEKAKEAPCCGDSDKDDGSSCC